MKITQLYDNLELFSEGDPIRHSLFVRSAEAGEAERLLVIDPPTDIVERFTLAPQCAVLFSGPGRSVPLPEYPMDSGDVVHLRIGEHLLDVHPRPCGRTIVYLPAVAVLYAGEYGSDMALPRLAPGSQGDEELETLRLLARLSKSRRLHLFLPHVGSISDDSVEVMTRLAADVAYLHGLRRHVLPAAAEGLDRLRTLEESSQILPENRRSALCWQIHRANVDTLFAG